MPRLTNSRTGVVVNVDDATADQLRSGDSAWGDADGESQTQPRKTAAKKATSTKPGN